MNKVITITLLLSIAIITAGCEKIYSVKDFKKDKKLRKIGNNIWIGKNFKKL
ncbi:EexN family lipoprotein [Bartonella rattimassiliensis]|uniref:EexN family lipoprotein n=1 Tax=Bartonella rattimassiliensis TaxID=270250 RepID=UPI0002E7138D